MGIFSFYSQINQTVEVWKKFERFFGLIVEINLNEAYQIASLVNINLTLTLGLLDINHGHSTEF